MLDESQQLARRSVIDVEVRAVDEDAEQQRLRVARELDRGREVLERELLHALVARQIEHPDVLARIFVRLDAATMHDGVKAGPAGIHGELLKPPGTPTRLALRVRCQPPRRL